MFCWKRVFNVPFCLQIIVYKWNFLHHDKRHVLTSEIYFRDMYCIYIYERRPATPCRSGNNRTATLAISLYSMCRFAGENADVEPCVFSLNPDIGRCHHPKTATMEFATPRGAPHIHLFVSKYCDLLPLFAIGICQL